MVDSAAPIVVMTVAAGCVTRTVCVEAPPSVVRTVAAGWVT